MTFQKQKICLITSVLLMILALHIGCGGKASGSDSYEAYEADFNSRSETILESTGLNEAIHGRDASAPASASGSTFASEAQTANQQTIQIESTVAPVARKLVKQANLRIQADPSFTDSEGNLSGVNQKIDELMNRYGAYSESTRSDGTSSYFTIRVPEMFYEQLIAGTSILGKTMSRTETAEDVTIKFYDLEGRLNTKKTLLATFQGYLGRTTSIDDIMKVETRISELQNEIDWLGNQLKRLGNLVDYATVELVVFTSNYIPKPGHTLGERIKDMFNGFGVFASGALLAILTITIYGGPIVIFCLIAFWLLFGRVGILKKAYRAAMYGDNEKKKERKNDNSKGSEQ